MQQRSCGLREVATSTMAIDPSIFGLRFKSNADLTPAKDDLDQFLARAKRPGSRVPRGRDLERYHSLIGSLRDFEASRDAGAEEHDIRDRILYGVIGLTQFASPGLEQAVGQFKYHLQQLAGLDLKKPYDFIKAAEREMAGLDLTKREQAARKERLRAMVGQRKEALKDLTKRRTELVEELSSIAQYVRENLVRIERVCEASIVMLVAQQVSRATEKRVVTSLKERFRERLDEARQQRPVTKQELQIVKRDFASLSRAMAGLIRDDVYTLTLLYEAVYEHVQRCAGAIEGSLAKARAGQDDLEPWTELEEALDALVRDYRFEVKAVALRGEPAYENVLREERRKVLDSLFALLERDRRTRQDRRAHREPRKYAAPTSAASERRAVTERRSARSRRR